MDKTMRTFDASMNPLLNALLELGYSGSIDEIYEKLQVLECENRSHAVVSICVDSWSPS